MAAFVQSNLFVIYNGLVCFTTDVSRGNAHIQRLPIEVLLTKRGLFLPFCNENLDIIDALNAPDGQHSGDLPTVTAGPAGMLVMGNGKIYELIIDREGATTYNRVLYGNTGLYVRAGSHDLEASAFASYEILQSMENSPVAAMAIVGMAHHTLCVPKAHYWQMPIERLCAAIESKEILESSFWKDIRALDLGLYR